MAKSKAKTPVVKKTSKIKVPKPNPKQLFLASFLMLFLELALIRWSSSNVIYLSYFTNFVLLGSFLGVGIGFLRAHKKFDLFPLAPFALVAFLAFVLAFPVTIDRSGGSLIYFGSFTKSGLPAWLTLPVIFAAVTAVMTMVAEGVSKRFIQFDPLRAYRLDILGSIAGIVVFSIISFAGAPPIVWGLVVAGCFMALLKPKLTSATSLFIACMLLLLGIESLPQHTLWSPYYKISMQFGKINDNSIINVSVNGIPHQTVESVEARKKTEPIYFLPYDRIVNNKLDDVLIVGAGNGSDVAIALAHGAKHVDAVEIDPVLYKIGKKYQPDRPYADARVSIHINDGRAFLEQTHKKYDLILFALPDSLTLVSGQSALRLESFLFTENAMQAVRNHLQVGGAFGMYNYYREQWLADRLAGTLEQTYGHAPCIDTVGAFGKLELLTISDSARSVKCETVWNRAATSNVPKPATDDWPFLYLRHRTLPINYILTIALIVAATLAIIRMTVGPFGQMKRYSDLFFMGSAFFLLETKSVVQFALLFGTTWFVNALVFVGILISVFFAIELSRRYKPRAWTKSVAWAVLFVSLAISYMIPADNLLTLEPGVRFIVAVLLAFTPVLTANVVFAQRFKDVSSSSLAFGANLLGAILGGLLEYSSLLFGYRTLILIVIGLYVLSFWSSKHVSSAD